MTTLTTLTSLPPELLLHILSFLPPTSLPNLRLLSHQFATLSLPLVFAHIIHTWLDPKISHSRIVALSHDLSHRSFVMWSPWASEPDDEVMGSWLRIVWMLCTRRGIDGEMRIGEGEEVLTPENFEELSGVQGMTGYRIKMGQNRFLLWRKSIEDFAREEMGRVEMVRGKIEEGRMKDG